MYGALRSQLSLTEPSRDNEKAVGVGELTLGGGRAIKVW